VAIVTAPNALYKILRRGPDVDADLHSADAGWCGSFHFFDSQHAWVQASTALVDIQDPEQVRRYASTLLFTSDAGLHWVKVNSPQPS
jgi:hypothetical protein